jgi:ABC-type lipoprotein release transport system permease subunit
MKINNLRKTMLTFVIGVFFGVAVIASYSFVNNNAATGTSGRVQTIDSNTAQQMKSNYLSTAQSFNDVLEGFALNKEQLDAMNRLNRENTSLSGFRIYLGANSSGGQVSVVYGIDAQGRDAVSNSIYSTGLTQSGPCPPVCD